MVCVKAWMASPLMGYGQAFSSCGNASVDKYRYWGRHLTVSVDGAAAARWNTSVRVVSTAPTAWSVNIRMAGFCYGRAL